MSLKSVTIPNTVTRIGQHAFMDCKDLTSITIPNSVISIGTQAFANCKSLKFVTIPESMTFLGYHTFYGCTNLYSIVSQIKEPFAIIGKNKSEADIFENFHDPFPLDVFLNSTLYVPEGTIDKYKTTEGWKDFMFIEEGNGGGEEPPMPKKCAQPTISYQNGLLSFTCKTEGATCQSTITNPDITSYSTNEVQLGVTYNISVYATKEGYEHSDVVTATLCWIDAEPMQAGTIEAEDMVTEVKAMPVLIQTDGSTISIQGVAEGTEISAYDTNGIKLSSAIANKGITTLKPSLPSGSHAIVKIGEKAIKVLMK